MANRFSAKNLIILATVLGLSLAGCSETTTASAPDDATPAELELRERAATMQRTVVEAIVVGGLAGAAYDFVIDNRRADGGRVSLFRSIATGAALGGVAGSYVGHLQSQYATREKRLERMRADLRANNAETAATLSVMRVVLANQTEELNRLRAAVAASNGDTAALAREVSEARANLSEMQRALEGAQNRRDEFSQSRSVIAGDVPDPASDAEIAALGERITQMRAVADSLASQL